MQVDPDRAGREPGTCTDFRTGQAFDQPQQQGFPVSLRQATDRGQGVLCSGGFRPAPARHSVFTIATGAVAQALQAHARDRNNKPGTPPVRATPIPLQRF